MSEIRVDNITNEAGTGAPNFPLGADGITPIGGYVIVQTDLVGAAIPDGDKHIKLEAGLTGSGEYNEGKLNNESVSGSSPLIEATAEIVDAESPLNGQTVHLLNTENRYLMPGKSPGTVANDQMQDHVHALQHEEGNFGYIIINASDRVTSGGGSNNEADALWSTSLFGIRTEARRIEEADGTGPARTDDHTNVKHMQVTYYMRIK